MSELYSIDGLAVSLATTLEQILDAPSGSLQVELTQPPRAEHGDFATNAALVAAKKAGRKPRELAAELGERWLAGEGGAVCARFEVAGPGFLNLFLKDTWYGSVMAAQLDAGAAYGRDCLPAAARQKINVEFVSVNPTGPLHVGHARYAAYGDALCRVLDFAGHGVTREFYVNDHGSQMTRFAQSLAARYGRLFARASEVPEDGYRGDYIVGLAERLRDEVGDRHVADLKSAKDDVAQLSPATLTELRRWGSEAMLDLFRATLARLRIVFDVWSFESGLYVGGDEGPYGFAGEVGAALRDLAAEDLLFEEEGAIWLRTTTYGDDKDRVLIRSNGDPTYFLSDIAYHRDKMDRGFAPLIDIWGADHHGYVARMKAAFTALPPHDPARLEVIIGQLVNLLESGAAKRMSKRRGDIVTVDDLVEAIGVDATRYLLVARSPDTPLELDLDLAVSHSNDNPVYYVQYAHARICSILRRLAEEGAAAGADRGRPDADEAPPVHPRERALITLLARWPQTVCAAAEQRAPHRIHTYLVAVASEFHVFYRECRVLGEDPQVTGFRRDLCAASRQVLAAGLELLGVEAPERM